MDETLEESELKEIHVVRSGWIPNLRYLNENISLLEQAAIAGKSKEVLDLLYELVPTFRPLSATMRNQLSRSPETNGDLWLIESLKADLA
jgi:hypothetical protein